MKDAVQSLDGRRNIRISLCIFEEKDEDVFERGMGKGPDDFRAESAGALYCRKKQLKRNNLKRRVSTTNLERNI